MTVKSTLLDKSFNILERIAVSQEPVTLKELAADLGLNTSTVSRIASDLAARNLIRKAGYHSFVPSTGLFFLGKCAADTPLIRAAGKLLEERANELNADLCLTAIEANRLVHICKKKQSGSELIHNKIPFWRSPLAAAILYKDRTAAHEFFRASIAEEKNKINLQQESAVFDDLLNKFSQDGCFIYKDPRIGWSITFPVHTADQFFAVSISGRDVDKCNIDRMHFECSRLASRLLSLLNSLFY